MINRRKEKEMIITAIISLIMIGIIEGRERIERGEGEGRGGGSGMIIGEGERDGWNVNF